MTTIILKEVKSFFGTIFGYIILALFLIAIGLLCWVFPDTNFIDYGFADMGTFFSFCPIIFLFYIPAIAMKSFAEEKKQGTLELLLTKPISLEKIVLGKYFSIVIIIILSLLPTLIYYFSIAEMGNPKQNIDAAAVVGSYLGLVLVGAVFAALGILFSVLTNNQIVAFVLSVFIGFILYFGLSALSSVMAGGFIKYWTNVISLDNQYEGLGKGLIDSRNIFFFFSIIFLTLFASVQILKKS